MKKIAFFFLSLLILSTTGCVTGAIWYSNPVVDSEYKKKASVNDNIVGAFEYKNLRIKYNQNNENLAPIQLPGSGYGFLGENYIYILTQGADELMQLNEIIKTIPLKAFDNSEGIIRLELTQKNDNVIEFKENYYVYISKKFTLTDKQTEVLKNLGFKETRNSDDSSWVKTIPIKGYVFQKDVMEMPATLKDKLNENYKVELYTYEKRGSFKPGNLANNIIITPLTLVADVIATPVIMLAFSDYIWR
ncbi:hypothetical protein EHE21_10405 [Proteus sp. GOKU]|jgi:hypothetical protein|uniref:hypothetical protein n=1 Tax=Proteus TaxID=583 RepID=UPI001892A332|nr:MULTISPECIES: hypothetical protein [Proteus]QPB79768.1 hypothetical protein EHE21_10405 [Proteus sp. GOKU]QQP25775.1 hypothetical protein D7029_10405 [Proteus vulgaris]WPC97565.1 hypothetical protein R5P25_11875 [Proteus terrae]